MERQSFSVGDKGSTLSSSVRRGAGSLPVVLSFHATSNTVDCEGESKRNARQSWLSRKGEEREKTD